MGAQGNTQPIIIKKKKKGGGDGHHGGAWKVAYADFVTAMMAFFMLMWLLNATTDKQRKGLADYFAPTIAINRVSGGGDGNFGGDSVFTEETLARSGNGATLEKPSEANKARGETGSNQSGQETAVEDSKFESMKEELMGRGGESTLIDNALEHINVEITDEGLVIEIFSTEQNQIFDQETGAPTKVLQLLTSLVSDMAQNAPNDIAIEGHVQAQPLVARENRVWEQSMSRATTQRQLLEGTGIDKERIVRVTGHADREPARSNPMSIRNDRIEIILLRE